jgi:hypothetical protein
MPDRNFRDVVAEDVVALGCRSEGPPALRTGRARSDLRGVRLSLSPGIQTDSHRNPLACPSKRASGRKPPSETFKFVIIRKETKNENAQYGRQGRKSSEPRAVKIGGLLIFIGRRDRRTASFVAKLRIASSGYLRSLSRCRVRLRGLRAQGLAAPRTHSRIRSIIAPGS